MNKKEITHTTFSSFIKELKPQFDDAKMTNYYSQAYYETEETNGAVLGFGIDLNGKEKTKKGDYERHLYIEFICIDSTKKCYIKTIDATYRKIYHFENGKTRFSKKLSTDTLPNELQKRVADIVLFVETIVLAYLKEIDKENEENKTTEELIQELQELTATHIFSHQDVVIKNKKFEVYLWTMFTHHPHIYPHIDIQIENLETAKTIFYRGDIETQIEFKETIKKAIDKIKKIEEKVLKEGITILTIEDFAKLYPNRLEANQSGKYVNLPQTKFLVCYEDDTYTAVDNTTQDFWCEDFKTKEDAIKWLNNEDL